MSRSSSFARCAATLWISRRLAEAMIERVRAGALKPEAAAVEFGKQCTCNIFNTVRAAEIIKGRWTKGRS
ncbi:MAG: hypothetical protein QXJ79_03855 [Candidatus Bathyarchaeia archaeon]